MVDPAIAAPVLAEAERRGWRISQVWNTHWHPDHTGGNPAIKAATGATITGPAERDAFPAATSRLPKAIRSASATMSAG